METSTLLCERFARRLYVSRKVRSGMQSDAAHTRWASLPSPIRRRFEDEMRDLVCSIEQMDGFVMLTVDELHQFKNEIAALRLRAYVAARKK